MTNYHFKIFLSILISFLIVISYESLIKNYKNINNFYFGLKKNINFNFYFDNNSKNLKETNNQFSYDNKNNFVLPTVKKNFFPSPFKTEIPEEEKDNLIKITLIQKFKKKDNIKKPTEFLLPTKTPKPTITPDYFNIDPSLARPGKTPDEVFDIASQKTCVPKEILKSIAYIESGKFFDVVSPKYFLLYNSYNWWNSEFLTEEKRICGGYGYNLNKGVVPNDSKFAGYRCRADNNNNLDVMGPMSVSYYGQQKYGKKVANLLGVNDADRRVILDALIIVGLIIKDNVRPQNCKDWNSKQIIKAACGYYGSCGIKDGSYYCATFCKNYKNFGGKGNCDPSILGDNCWQ
ncbi:MAG: hypothetical protein N2593_00230 [Patescibacteria group bacterium]|nr:hypothetical protein [Patescibacteria group bacterium]